MSLVATPSSWLHPTLWNPPPAPGARGPRLRCAGERLPRRSSGRKQQAVSILQSTTCGCLEVSPRKAAEARRRDVLKGGRGWGVGSPWPAPFLGHCLSPAVWQSRLTRPPSWGHLQTLRSEVVVNCSVDGDSLSPEKPGRQVSQRVRGMIFRGHRWGCAQVCQLLFLAEVSTN